LDDDLGLDEKDNVEAELGPQVHESLDVPRCCHGGGPEADDQVEASDRRRPIPQ
jgi:hypothetical protein